MFNRYWRSFPWFLQFIQFIILIAVLASFFVFALTPLILKLTDVSANDVVGLSEHSPRKVINAALLIQFLTSIGIFLLPSLFYAYFSHPQPKKYLGLIKPGKAVQLILVVIIMLSAMPLVASIAEWMMQFDLSGTAKKMQEDNDRMVKAFTSMGSPVQLFFTFMVVAILPGLSEELFFRGLLMRFAAKRSKSIYFPLILSAMMFSLMHPNIYGWVSIFIAGLLLGSFYYLTGSIWSSILAHICFNGLQVVLIYLSKDEKAIENNHVPLSLVVGSTLVAIGAFFLLWKNRTPLPSNWHSDFSEEELMKTEQ
jgi:uncharacterized protein